MDDAVKHSKILRSATVKDLTRQNGDLTLDSLQSERPVKADKGICDMIGTFQVIDEPCRRIQHLLKSAY
jgi:hypothetical protein